MVACRTTLTTTGKSQLGSVLSCPHTQYRNCFEYPEFLWTGEGQEEIGDTPHSITIRWHYKRRFLLLVVFWFVRETESMAAQRS